MAKKKEVAEISAFEILSEKEDTKNKIKETLKAMQIGKKGCLVVLEIRRGEQVVEHTNFIPNAKIETIIDDKTKKVTKKLI